MEEFTVEEFTVEGFEGQIGASISPFAFDFSGLIADFRIYSTALSADQVLELYENNCAEDDQTSNLCTENEALACSAHSTCSKTDSVIACACWPGYEDVNGNGSLCKDVDECLLERICHELAFCDNFPGGHRCTCPEGFLGDGRHCQSESFAIRSVINFPRDKQLDRQMMKFQYSRALLPEAAVHRADNIVISESASEGTVQLTINALFASHAEAARAIAAASDPRSLAVGGQLVDGPDVYRWVAQSTADPIAIRPTGLTVDSVHFEPTCKRSGCWAIAVTYTARTDSFHVFYLPKAEGNDDADADRDYSIAHSRWGMSPEDTFRASNFPCGSEGQSSAGNPWELRNSESACCLESFLAMYRPAASFAASLSGVDFSACASEATPAAGLPMFIRGGHDADPQQLKYSVPQAPGSLCEGVFADSAFSGMELSEVVSAGVVDPFVGIYKAILYLDESELRTRAGQLTGTIGVEHTVDTFVGYASFSPTGVQFLDSAVTQLPIHLERTSLFSVSSHGSNAYSFLRYINMRLVAVLRANTQPALASGQRAARTEAHYVQVTFSLGAEFGPNPDSGLLPLDSVRVGKGERLPASVLMEAPCAAYTADPPSFASKEVFDSRFPQQGSAAKQCAPNAAMCQNPTETPDGFVTFNIPLGIDWLPEPAADLSQKVFVHMAVSAVDSPRNGGARTQLMTTLSSTVPVVAGGLNVFCDSVTVESDLTAIVQVDLIVGAAADSSELSRLNIIEDIASSTLRPKEPAATGAESVESGLMTLVVRGNESFFNLGGTGAFSVHVEDLFSVHIMETSDRMLRAVQDLLSASSDDVARSSGADSVDDGFALNGAFSLAVDRANNRAFLNPTPALEALCPFRSPRPSASNPFPAVCVLRRDIQARSLAAPPSRFSAEQGAVEIEAAQVARDEREGSAQFMQEVLGASDYAAQLGKDFAWTLAQRYRLNGRFARAFIVNPAYEWTPQQTNQQSRFQLSQKILLFALINLDEGLVRRSDARLPPSHSSPPPPARRVLLSTTRGSGATVGSASVRHRTSPTFLFSKAFNLPEEKVATFDVEVRLTSAQACLAETALRGELSSLLVGHLSATASPIAAAHILSLSVNPGPVQCRRALSRSLQGTLSAATASLQLLVMFSAHFNAHFDTSRFQDMPEIAAVAPAEVSSSVNLGPVRPQDVQTWHQVPDERGTDGQPRKLSIAVVAAGIGSGCAVLLGLGTAFYVWRQRGRARGHFMRRGDRTAAEGEHRRRVEGLKAELSLEDKRPPLEVVPARSSLTVDDLDLDVRKLLRRPPSLDCVASGLSGKDSDKEKMSSDTAGNRVSPVARARQQLVSTSVALDLDVVDNLHSSLTADELKDQLNEI